MARNIPSEIAEAARIIAPIDKAPWLPDLLWQWLPTLVLDRGAHAIQPTKIEMREVLLEVSQTTTTISEQVWAVDACFWSAKRTVGNVNSVADQIGRPMQRNTVDRRRRLLR